MELHTTPDDIQSHQQSHSQQSINSVFFSSETIWHAFAQSPLPDALHLQYVWICSIEWGHKATKGNVFHQDDCQRVGEEDRALVNIQDRHMDGGRRARAIADVWNQGIFILYFDEEHMKGGGLII